MLEKDMSAGVVDWLFAQSLGTIAEASLPVNGTCRRTVDVVGWSVTAIVAVEMKLQLDDDVIRQAASCGYGADIAYVCVPARAWSADDPRIMELATRGIGLLTWENGRCTLALEAVPMFPPQGQQNEWRRRLARAHAGTAGGVKGSDSGKRTEALLIEWARSNPDGSWRRAHREVPNTFGKFKDMRSRFRQALSAEGLTLANG